MDMEIANWKNRFGGNTLYCFSAAGLTPRDNRRASAALPERRPGRRIEKATVVESHNCDYGYWFEEGILLDSGELYLK